MRLQADILSHDGLFLANKYIFLFGRTVTSLGSPGARWTTVRLWTIADIEGYKAS